MSLSRGIYSPRVIGSLHDRLYAKTEPGPDGCLNFTGCIRANGYGDIGDDARPGRSIRAHRAAWRVERGDIPAGMDVCHRCDNRRCVNVDHLFLGTRLDNMMDAKRKGRTASGARHGGAKLSAEDVRTIRYLSGAIAQRQLAARFGVSVSNISQIVRGYSWREDVSTQAS